MTSRRNDLITKGCQEVAGYHAEAYRVTEPETCVLVRKLKLETAAMPLLTVPSDLLEPETRNGRQAFRT